MRHLVYVIAFTGRFGEMRKFYERGLGLPVRRAEEDWVEFDTAGASLALHRMKDPSRQGLMLRFVTTDLDGALAELSERGLEPDGEVVEFRDGRLANFWDVDGNPLTLLEPAAPVPSGAGPPIATVIVNVADMVAAVGFYRDRFAIPVLLESSWWTELDTGATKVALHPKSEPTDELSHNAQAVVVGFEVADLEALGRELAERGLDFSGGPVDERYGRFAEVTDPDGNVVLFRRPAARAPLSPVHHDVAPPAPAFDDDAPSHAAMRKPLKKRTTAGSRLLVKPEYHAKKPAVARPKHPAKPAAVRNNTRLKTKPATGRLKKAERKSAVRKKTAVARASRTKPVKRAAAVRAASKRVAAKRAAARRGARARGR